jgi:hypothetical protein
MLRRGQDYDGFVRRSEVGTEIAHDKFGRRIGGRELRQKKNPHPYKSKGAAPSTQPAYRRPTALRQHTLLS